MWPARRAPACAAIRRSASAGPNPDGQPLALDVRIAGDQPDTTSQDDGEPPSTSRIASMTIASARGGLDAAIAASIRGRTAGWMIASRS
jgi:hypothetical protein